MSFSALAPEILELVVFQIKDRKTLSSFVQTCRKFHEAAHTEITAQQFERFIKESSAMESQYPWHFLLASHKTRQLGEWAFADADAESNRPRELMDAMSDGVESLASFAVSKLGLTYMDVILERTFYSTLYVPLRDHIDPLLDDADEPGSHMEGLEVTLLDMGMYIGICRHQFKAKLQTAVKDDSLKTGFGKRRSLGLPQKSELGREFLRRCAFVCEQPGFYTYGHYTQIRKLIKVMTHRLTGWRWPMWKIDDNGIDIMPHVYGFAGILALFEGRRDHLPSPSILDALSTTKSSSC